MACLSLADLQNVELRMLISFKEICEQQKFSYALAGGTLLGAIRHNGFIPWDDDIDLIMMRSDYEKFIRYCNTTPGLPFHIVSAETCAGYSKGFAKLMDNGTYLESDTDNDAKLGGVFLDIFPVDYLGDTRREALRVYRSTSLLREILVAKQWKRYSRSKTHSFIYEPVRLFFFLISRLFCGKTLLKMIDQKRQTSRKAYSCCIFGSYRTKEIMPTDIYENRTTHEFEGHKFSILKDYDVYLTAVYGNYMQLPPEEKRITHHTFTAYWK